MNNNDMLDELARQIDKMFSKNPKPDGLDATDCTGIMQGNADLELSDEERIGNS